MPRKAAQAKTDRADMAGNSLSQHSKNVNKTVSKKGWMRLNNKVKSYTELATKTSKQITNSYTEWTAFLATAARLYKYPYHEQLLIYAQRPDATACASFDVWNGRMNRAVRRGSKGIAILDTTHGAPRIRYVFDIADTVGRQNARRPYLWQMREDNLFAALADRRAQRGCHSRGIEVEHAQKILVPERLVGI